MNRWVMLAVLLLGVALGAAVALLAPDRLASHLPEAGGERWSVSKGRWCASSLSRTGSSSPKIGDVVAFVNLLRAVPLPGYLSGDLDRPALRRVDSTWH